MRKLMLTALLSSFIGGTFAQTTEGLNKIVENVYGRNIESLNGYWNRIVDPLECGYWDYRKKPDPNGFFKDTQVDNWKTFKEYNFDGAPLLHVPGDWNTQDDKLYYYEGTVWYKKTFDYKPGDERVYLYFGGANYDTKVYLNGSKVGEHQGGYTPFNFEVTDLVKPGENFMIVKVDNKRHADAVPTDNFDWWNYGGITRDVMLVKLPKTFIEDYKIQLKKGAENVIAGQVKLNGKQPNQNVKIEIPELKISQTVQTDDNGEASFEVKSKMTRWSPENPKLYDVKIASETDQVNDQIGFRTIDTQNSKILLNGKPIFLKGISLHEEAPFRSGRAYTLEEARMMLDMAQELGCNFVRLAHYPHNEYIVREAERRGILLWSEIPVYWTIAFDNPETYKNAQNQLDEMIQRDKNRASIIIWSIANETPHGDARDKFLSSLSGYAKAKDNTRLISMAMERSQKNEKVQILKDEMNKYVDVISFNQYLGWYDGTWEKVANAEWEFEYNKPVIISESGGAAVFGKHGDSRERWTEEYQEELYKKTVEMYDRMPKLAGTTPWIMMDFRSPRRLQPVIQQDFNRKGLYSNKGQKKKAFYVLRDWYKTK